MWWVEAGGGGHGESEGSYESYEAAKGAAAGAEEPQPRQGRWNWVMFKDLSNPTRFMILLF